MVCVCRWILITWLPTHSLQLAHLCMRRFWRSWCCGYGLLQFSDLLPHIHELPVTRIDPGCALVDKSARDVVCSPSMKEWGQVWQRECATCAGQNDQDFKWFKAVRTVPHALVGEYSESGRKHMGLWYPPLCTRTACLHQA